MNRYKLTGRVPAMMAVCALLVCALSSAALADRDAKIEKMPGYVDFDAFSSLSDQEAKVEVYLKDPMLKLVSGFIKGEDPELFEILSKLKLVRVLVYDITSDLATKMSKVTTATAKELDKKGWERIVRVREDGENVDIYLKPSADYEWIDGLVVMVVDDSEEAVFVNIVGQIHPDDIGRLAEHFDIDELDIDIKSKKQKDDN